MNNSNSGIAEEKCCGTNNSYKIALAYFKEHEGRSFHVQFDDKIRLVSLTQQASHGTISNANLPPIGALDVIGKQRRAAWTLLGDMDKTEAKLSFISELEKIVPDFKKHLEERLEEEKRRLELEEQQQREREQTDKLETENKEKKMKEDLERRKIQDVLNRQTFTQFKSYAEQQYPDSPDQQAVLIKQLQEQHYYQYTQQLVQLQATSPHTENGEAGQRQEGADQAGQGGEGAAGDRVDIGHTANCAEGRGSSDKEMDCLPGDPCQKGCECERECSEVETSLSNLQINDCSEEKDPEEASMWTRKDVNDFKETIRREEGDAIIKVGHGETVTVRVPTHRDGKSLYWEFATDSYDIGFGVFFEWVEAEDTQVTVHISDSEDEEEEEEDVGSEEEGGDNVDPESGKKGYLPDNGPPTSCIVPIYRRDCHEEVYAGSHNYPAQGVYLLKFDNTFSLWRSKTLYYRVYYTR